MKIQIECGLWPVVAAFIALVGLLAFAWLPWVYLRDSDRLVLQLNKDKLVLLACCY